MEIPIILGGYREIIPAKPEGTRESWFTNDHTFIKGHDGLWHCYAINNPMIDDMGKLYREHPYLLHATAENIEGPWTRQGFAIDESAGNRYVGAPYVVRHGDEYLMMVETMWDEKRGLEIARSTDLFHWERDRKEVITNQPEKRRDPCIIKDEEQDDWLVYLCSVEQGNSLLTLCRTKDFETYSESKTILALNDGCPWGSLESPFVVKRGDHYYLFFTHSLHHYRETIVLRSTQCDHFDWADQVTTLHSHAAEIIQDEDNWFITTCGPEGRKRNNKHGIEIAPLKWMYASGTVFEQ